MTVQKPKVKSIFCESDDANYRYQSDSSKAQEDGFVYAYAQDESYLKELTKRKEVFIKNIAGDWEPYVNQRLLLCVSEQYSDDYKGSYVQYLFNKYIANQKYILNTISSAGLPTPSDEQFNIVQVALTGQDIKVQAFAGTGKTTTIKMIAACLNMSSTYVVFNKAAKLSAENEIQNANVTTAHGLAFHQVIGSSLRFDNKFQNSAKTWFLDTVKTVFPQYPKQSLGFLIRTVKRFIKSSDLELSENHISQNDIAKIKKNTESIPKKAIHFIIEIANDLKEYSEADLTSELTKYLKGLRQTSELKKIRTHIDNCITNSELRSFIKDTINNYKNYSDSKKVSLEDFPNNQTYKRLAKDSIDTDTSEFEKSINQIVADSKRLWNEISSEKSSYPINHDCYLKIWQLSDPKINTPVIFIDESQDLDPVMLSVLLKQKAQKIWVGDRYQQIYAWRGAINAMDKVCGCHEYSLTETYRFSSEISSIANQILSKLGERMKITSHKSSLRNEPEQIAYIARYNSSLIDRALALAELNKTFSLQKFYPDKIETHCRSIIDLYRGSKPFMDLYSVFSSIDELEAFLEEEYNDEMNRALSFCKSSNFDLNKIRLKLNAIACYNKEDANIVLTTAHQSKGLEWDKVVIADDFENKLSSPNCDASEFNLIYVAVTRAKNILKGVESLPSIMTLFTKAKSPKVLKAQNTELTEV